MELTVIPGTRQDTPLAPFTIAPARLAVMEHLRHNSAALSAVVPVTQGKDTS